jgi:putative oxidoreductase
MFIVPVRAQRALLFAARVGMASLATFGGLQKIVMYSGAVEFASSFSIPAPAILMPLAIILELGCAAALLTTRYCRPAAAILAVWTFVLGLWFHRFWSVTPQEWQMMIDSFFHHFVMTGGFIYVAIFGADGRISLDDRADRTTQG